jgi:hypothetical protein
MSQNTSSSLTHQNLSTMRQVSFLFVFVCLFLLFLQHFVFCRYLTRPLWCGRPYFTSTSQQESSKHLFNPKFVVKAGLIPYTTDEQNGTLLVSVDASFGSQVLFRADTSKFTVVNTTKISTSSLSIFYFDLSKFPLGVYLNVTSTIRSEDGTLLATTVTVIGRFPSKKNVVKVRKIP